ncbi:hypothetical protein RvY_11419 [Ramazzottius varieornatus]|uniref:Reverse transcriptase domain-containing protein n=1 Tax=Ramazzottius varieornatus TaxID=947166 RepID=A0A1D1VKE3_RAMVA|nr:hypothetical protein RvY_11419 [Ramazzottius varieornatus]
MVEYEVVGLEALWVKVIALRMNLLIGVVYAPGYDSEVFSKLRTSMERSRSHLRRNILMLGDFNCPNISWSDKASGSSERERDLLSLQSEFRLWQKVRQITRERGKSCSSLELVFVSQLGLIRNVRTIKPPAATNDHHGLQFFLMLMTPKFVVKSRKQWKVDDVTSTEFRRMLASVDWNGMFDVQCNSDVAVSVFQEKFLSAASSCFQLKTVGSGRLLRPSLSATVVEYLRKCRSAYQKWRKTEDPADQTAWKALEARKKRLILRDKHRRLRNIAKSFRRHSTAVWDPIPPIPVPGSDDRYLVYPQDKAEFISKTLADEYVDCPVHCKAHLPPLHVCLMEPAISPRCPDLLITTTAILAIIRKLDVNKAAGSSLITNRLLKVAGTAIVYPLPRLFNLIIQTGQFPTVWKKADVVPIPKKGGSAFRPISLLPPLSKLFEKNLADHLSNYLYQNKLFSDSQYGFRKRRSTEMQLARMSHHFPQVLLQRNEADVVLLDFFPSMELLVRYWPCSSDYLRGRSQLVMVDGYFSDDQPVKSGVPQGSVFGPTFFTVAVNSLSTCVKSTVLQYADDVVLHRTVSSEDDCRALQEDLENLAVWCRNAGLDMNSRKSQHLRISNRKEKTEIPGGSYKFASDPKPTENEGECLGVTYSSRLDWTAQVDKVTAKCRKRLYAINVYFPRCFGSVKQLLFKSIVRSVMDYASSAWSVSAKCLQRQLENIQKFLRSIRFSKMETTDSHDTDFIQYRQHLAEVQWLPLWQRRL